MKRWKAFKKGQANGKLYSANSEPFETGDDKDYSYFAVLLNHVPEGEPELVSPQKDEGVAQGQVQSVSTTAEPKNSVDEQKVDGEKVGEGEASVEGATTQTRKSTKGEGK